MKVLFIPSWYSSDEEDLNGSFIKDQAIDLRGRGQLVSVAYASGHQIHKFDFRKIGDLFKSGYKKENGVLTYRKSFIKIARFNLINRILWTFFMKKLVLEYVRKEGVPDVIHAHSIMWAGLVANWAKKRFKIPYVVTEHRGRFVQNSNFHIPENYKRIFEDILKRASKLILVSESQKDYFTSLTERISVIPNYVGTHFLQTKVESDLSDPVRLISVCHLTKQKNINTLINTLKKLRDAGHDVVLEIVGDGRERQRLEELVENLGLVESVIFRGEIKNEKLPSYLVEADIFVLPSLFESFGIALVEAMACGLPVVGTKNGGPAYFVDKPYGRIVDTSKHQELYNAILSIIDQKPDRRQIQQFVRERFSKELILSRIEDEYENARNSG
jgi:L-malate glycosyltransferase